MVINELQYSYFSWSYTTQTIDFSVSLENMGETAYFMTLRKFRLQDLCHGASTGRLMPMHSKCKSIPLRGNILFSRKGLVGKSFFLRTSALYSSNIAKDRSQSSALNIRHQTMFLFIHQGKCEHFGGLSHVTEESMLQ